MPSPLVRAIEFASSPTGRKLLAQAVRVARSDEGKKLIGQARKVASTPEGRKLIAQATRLRSGGTAKAPGTDETPNTFLGRVRKP